MRVCPECLTRYPTASRFCDLDGATLQEPAETGIEIEFSTATAAESPSGRRQNDVLDQVPPLPGKTTLVDGGTRLSSSTPSAPAAQDSQRPPRPPRKKRSRTRLQAEQRVGQVLGSYRLQEVLGTGGMGAVYLAEHIKLGRQVALKLLHPQYAKRRDALARFFQEAQAVNRIRHKNIVDVTDLVELDDGTAFIIMELLAGQSLGERLNAVGLLTQPATLSVLIQICDALAAAHEADIVHRDLKPDNIFLSQTTDGDLLVKLLDFGVAKLINPDSEVGHRTAAGSVVGTPAFMSPEQAAGLEIDQRSDLYSLGAIMYQLFTGQPVFSGRSFSELVNKHLSVEPMAPRQTPGGLNLDPELEAIIMRCLRKSPDARFQSARELREALVDYLSKLAADLGTNVETESGIYRLNAGRPATYTSPPSTMSGPLDPLVIHETALSAGDLDPNWQTGARSSRLPLYIAVGVALVATLVAIGVVSEGRDKRDEPVEPKAAIEPTPEPARAPPQDARPVPIVKPIYEKVKFTLDSEPRGAQVFDRGSSIPKCESTPCEITIDPRDGGSPSRRQFVIRAAGFEDQTIEVLLNKPEPEYRVTLEPRPEMALEEPPETDKTGGRKTSGRKTGGRKTGGRKTGGKTSGGKTSGGKTSGGKTSGGKTSGGKSSGGKSSGGKTGGPVGSDVILDPFSGKKKSK